MGATRIKRCVHAIGIYCSPGYHKPTDKDESYYECLKAKGTKKCKNPYNTQCKNYDGTNRSKEK